MLSMMRDLEIDVLDVERRVMATLHQDGSQRRVEKRFEYHGLSIPRVWHDASNR